MRTVKRNTKTIVNFTVLGFVVAVLGMFMDWMMFSSRDSLMTIGEALLARLTCPFLATPLWDEGWGYVPIPFLNAALYGFVTWLVLGVRSKGKRHTAELQP